jgi:hypothetical protein
MRRSDCHDRIKRTKSSYDAALRTVTAMIAIVEQRPDYLRIHRLEMADLRALKEELHDLYFVQSNGGSRSTKQAGS